MVRKAKKGYSCEKYAYQNVHMKPFMDPPTHTGLWQSSPVLYGMESSADHAWPIILFKLT